MRLIDVADQAGVSQATASRVLNGKPGVSGPVRAAVLSAADALGYARTRSTGRRLIGVIVPELENPIFAQYAQRLGTILAQSGATPMICTQTHGGVVEDEWIEMLLERGAAALIVVSGMHADTHSGTERYRRLRELRIPLVLVNGYVSDVDAVCISDDDRAAMSLAVTHLSSLGHERIGLAVGPERYVPVVRKVEGFVQAAESAGVEALVEHSLFSIEGGRVASLQLLDRGATAIACGSDLMALGAIQACGSRRLSVPGDVSVVGYDDSPVVAFTGPPLTTIRQSVPAMCRAAVRALREELDGRPSPRQEYLFRPELVVRGSTGAAPEKGVPSTAPRRRRARPAGAGRARNE